MGSLRPNADGATEATSSDPHHRNPNYNFRPYDQKQLLLLPPSLDDWLPSDHYARALSDVVDYMDRCGDLEPFYVAYRGDGQGAWSYHPKMMVKVVLYGFCIGVVTTRKIARRIETDVAFRFLSGNQYPDFRTIGHFFRIHEDALEHLFPVVLRICREVGMTTAGRVALDGRMVQGNASLEKSRTMENITRQVRSILEEARRLEAEEEALYGEDRGDELPEDLQDPKQRKLLIEEARERVNQAVAQKNLSGLNQTQSKRDGNAADSPKGAPGRLYDKLQGLLEAHDELIRQEDEWEEKVRHKQQEMIDQRKREEEAAGRKKPGQKPLTPDEKVVQEKKKREERARRNRQWRKGKKKGGEKVKKPQVNMTDPESRIMKTRNGWKQGYNDQTMVDPGSQIITASQTVSDHNDKKMLNPMLEEHKKFNGSYPDDTITDSGFYSEDAAHRASKKTELWSTTEKDWKTRKKHREKGYPRGRIPKNATPTELMERKLATKLGRMMYKERYVVECIQGQLSNRGFKRFYRRGVKKAGMESKLWKTGSNLLKMFKAGKLPS